MASDLKYRRSSTSSRGEVAGTGNELIDPNVFDDVPRHRHPENFELRRSTEEEEESSLCSGSQYEPKFRDPWLERRKWWNVYLLHFMFMWNSRTYEYVSIFLVARAFPGGLTATSIRGLVSTIGSMLFASAVGNWIDRAPLRMPALIKTIALNHAAIILSYLAWLIWPLFVADPNQVNPNGPYSNFNSGLLYSIIVFLDIVHDLSAIGNRLAVDRDIVPVLVGPITPDTTYGLTQVNAVMVRIDLLCKLVAPSLLPLVTAFFASRSSWILLLSIITALFFLGELLCVFVLFAECKEELLPPKTAPPEQATMGGLGTEDQYDYLKPEIGFWPKKFFIALYQDPAARLKHFFSFPMWPASVSIALLQLTVLAYSATLITYLLEIGFELSSITIARASGAILALSSTIITPWAVNFLRKRNNRRAIGGQSQDDDEGSEGRIVRTVGIWGISSQLLCMIPVVLVLWNLSPPPSEIHAEDEHGKSQSPHLIIPLLFFGFLSLSRIGHYTAQLMVQELGQVEIPASHRSTFAGTEQSFRSFGALGHWAATMVFSRPDQFRMLALGSLIMVAISVAVYGLWWRTPIEGEKEEYEGVAMIDLGRDDQSDA